jgi:uncharacterized protein
MQPTEFTPVSALVGGSLVGLATGLTLLLNGKIAGISGVCGRILRPAAGDVAWRVFFIAGMVVGGAGAFLLYPPAAVFSPATTRLGLMSGAGALIGFGARLSGGCTSGHGVCGIARASIRSLTGTCVFMAVAAVTVYITRHLLGGATP